MKELLRIRDVRVALGAKAVSHMGDAMTLTALSLLIATSGRPLDLTVLLVAFAVPIVALSGCAGRLVDRHDSRWLLLGAGLLQVAGSAGLLGSTDLHWQVVCILLVQSGQAVTSPAWGALLPRIVGEERIGQAVGLQQSLASVAWMAGAPLGGFAYGLVGFHGVIAVDTATFLAVALAALAVRTRRVPVPRSRAEAAAEGPWSPAGPSDPSVGVPTARALESGLRVVARDRVLLVLVVAMGLFVIALEGVNVVEPFLVVDVLRATPAAYGLLGLSMGIGIVAGSAAGGRVAPGRRRLWCIAGSAATMGLMLGASGLARGFWVLPPLFLLAGVGNGIINTLTFATFVGRAPESARGRVLATVSGVSRGCSMLALVLGGVAGQALGPRTTFVVAGALAVAVSPLALLALRHVGRAGDLATERAEVKVRAR